MRHRPPTRRESRASAWEGIAMRCVRVKPFRFDGNTRAWGDAELDLQVEFRSPTSMRPPRWCRRGLKRTTRLALEAPDRPQQAVTLTDRPGWSPLSSLLLCEASRRLRRRTANSRIGRPIVSGAGDWALAVAPKRACAAGQATRSTLVQPESATRRHDDASSCTKAQVRRRATPRTGRAMRIRQRGIPGLAVSASPECACSDSPAARSPSARSRYTREREILSPRKSRMVANG